MIDALKPYPEYVESGVPWLGRVPRTWRVPRMKAVVRERSEKGHPAEPLLAATQSRGVIAKSDYESRTVTAQKDFHLLKLVEIGDFVISLRSFEGGVELARARGIISPAYTVLSPRDADDRRYLAWLLKAPPFVEGLTLAVTGIREGQNIDYERLSRSGIPMPPAEDQLAIVRLLDHADRLIRRHVAAKRKLIALLQEQKQAIIHRAVTRGLDPTVAVKPSGVAWLGDIPAHWAATKLKRVVDLLTGFPFESSGFVAEGQGTRLLRGINVTPGALRWQSVVCWPADRAGARELSRFELALDDIVLGMDRPIVSAGVRAARVQRGDVPAFLLQRVARIRARAELDSGYLLLLLQAGGFAEHLSPIFTGISVPHISPEQIGAFDVSLPGLTEQQAILSRLADTSQELDRAVSAAKRERDLMQEYRARLVADVVTGKFDVRAVAAALPAGGPDDDGDLAVAEGGEPVEDDESDDAARPHEA